jgi:plastocyanin
MNVASTSTTTSARRPLTALGKFICGVQFLAGAGSLFGAFAIGFPGGVALATMATIDIALGILFLTGARWAPIAGAVIAGGGLLYAFFGTPYPAYHLAHLDDSLHTVITAAIGLMFVVFAAMLAAIAQNYREPAGKTPRWFSFILTGIIGAVLGAILISVIAQPTTASGGGASADSTPMVHLGLNAFSPTLIAVPEGSQLRFTEDSAITHILTYGAWSNGHTELATPANAPALANRQISGGSFAIGPFTTPGTYHILCTVHPGMQVTVIVP